MRRVISLIALLLLLPSLAAADSMTAIALGKLLPLFGVLALISCGLLGLGFRLVMRDLDSAQENPRPLTLVVIVAGVLFGAFLSAFGGILSSKTGPTFPNLFTEVFAPLAIVGIARKKLRRAGRQSAAWWLGLSSAGLLVLAGGAVGLFTSEYAAARGGTNPLMVYLLCSLVVWFVVGRMLYPQLPAPAARRTGLLWVPFIGVGLAALYATLLYLAHLGLTYNPRASNYLYAQLFLRDQLLRAGLAAAFGVLGLLVTTWNTSASPDEPA